jgi:hypothetical protein
MNQYQSGEYLEKVPDWHTSDSSRKKSQTIMDIRTQFGHLHYFNKEGSSGTRLFD